MARNKKLEYQLLTKQMVDTALKEGYVVVKIEGHPTKGEINLLIVPMRKK